MLRLRRLAIEKIVRRRAIIMFTGRGPIRCPLSPFTLHQFAEKPVDVAVVDFVLWLLRDRR